MATNAREIFIGDVHGMSATLEALLTALAIAPADTVVFLGDLLDKGPDPVGAVDLAASLSALSGSRVILVEGNHEDLHRRYRRNLQTRPEVAAEQAERVPELVATTAALSAPQLEFLEGAQLYFRSEPSGTLAVHAGIPANLQTLPPLKEIAQLPTTRRWTVQQVLRTRYLTAETHAFVVYGDERPGDPLWADVYDGRFGHVVFGHNPFLRGPASFPHATGIDTGACQGGDLTALVIAASGERAFVAVPAHRDDLYALANMRQKAEAPSL